MMTFDRLRELALVLLDESASEGELKLACRELFTSLSEIAGQETISQATTDTKLAHGLALSPAGAAACIDDPFRTAMFVRGVHAAVSESFARLGTCIEVVDAGTGPFAALVLPVMAVSSPERVRFTLIDIHAESIRSAGDVLAHFGLTPFIRQMVVGDATQYRHPPELPLHVVVLEVLQEALAAEPQVAITRQLVPQLVEGGFLIPEEIAVDLVLENPNVLAGMDVNEAAGEPGVPVGRVLTLDKSFAAIEEEEDGRLPLGKLTIPRVPEHAIPAYVTQIGVFRHMRLSGRDCGLTIPMRVSALHGVAEGEEVAFFYRLGPRPGIEFQCRVATVTQHP